MLTKYRLLINQLLNFFLAGAFAVFLDYLVYRLTFNSLGSIFSKLFGFYSGVVLSFFINSSYTFKRKGTKFFSSIYFFKYLIVLTISMLINVFTNYFMLDNFSSVSGINFIAFLMATFLSMVFNFLNLKFVVFL